MTKDRSTRVTKAGVPETWGKGNERLSRTRKTVTRGWEWIQVANTIAPQKGPPILKILHRETIRVKFYRDRVVFGKLADRD